MSNFSTVVATTSAKVALTAWLDGEARAMGLPPLPRASLRMSSAGDVAAAIARPRLLPRLARLVCTGDSPAAPGEDEAPVRIATVRACERLEAFFNVRYGAYGNYSEHIMLKCPSTPPPMRPLTLTDSSTRMRH